MGVFVTDWEYRLEVGWLSSWAVTYLTIFIMLLLLLQFWWRLPGRGQIRLAGKSCLLSCGRTEVRQDDCHRPWDVIEKEDNVKMISPDRTRLTSREDDQALVHHTITVTIPYTLTGISSLHLQGKENSGMLFLAEDISWLVNYKRTGRAGDDLHFHLRIPFSPGPDTDENWWALLPNCQRSRLQDLDMFCG